MWEISGWVAWAVAAIVFAWLIIDFFKVNMKYSETVLLSSKEGVDELFPTEAVK